MNTSDSNLSDIRRCNLRARVGLPVAVITPGRCEVTSTLNLGPGGALIRSIGGLSEGAEVRLRLIHHFGPVEVPARVVRRQRGCWALRFIDLTPDASEQIQAILGERLASALRERAHRRAVQIPVKVEIGSVPACGVTEDMSEGGFRARLEQGAGCPGDRKWAPQLAQGVATLATAAGEIQVPVQAVWRDETHTAFAVVEPTREERSVLAEAEPPAPE